MPNSDPPAARPWPIEDLLRALVFLTRLPMPVLGTSPRGLLDAAWCFPLVGALVAAIAGAVAWAGWWIELPPLVLAVLAVIVTALVTGGLHEDGLADLADGLGGGRDPAHRIEIMRDSRTGAHGALALILISLTKVAALSHLFAIGLEQALIGLLLAHGVARVVMAALVHGLPPASESGLARAAGTPSGPSTCTAIVIALAATGWLVPLPITETVLGAAFAVGVGMHWLARRKLGGYTGDVLGGTEQIAEAAILSALCAQPLAIG